ncbi:acetylornithine deacetylase [Psychrobacter sanguinis]|uniref:acetylornithine deacetylase n=1 Tax=Psychrobacter sanguinis TaxID=861445 RepID=UPI00020C7EFD|nr:acetylornithine deacetylase [Psychrobacter sanguinis]EGK09472.1 acetylornithine deacetylase [Psychrobacter sp. 1501(2011)]MCD9152351.1 acetylornithine deacetylase [Psychrobacter sanguinis]
MSISEQSTMYPSQSVEWLKRLIAFDTVSRHSNLALIEEVQAYCISLGLEPVLTFNDTTDREHSSNKANQSKANLFVSVPAGGGLADTASATIKGGIVLSGHTDVVTVDGQDWLSDPFKAEIRGDKLYGRGACDMKGFIACALNLLPQAVALSQQGQLRKPLHLALSFDEEVGCLGAPLMLEELSQRGINPDYCIVGEPSSMKMVVAHKGISVFRCSVHGKSAHSSLTHQGINAISYAAKLIGFIDELASQLAQSDQVDPMFDVPYSTLSIGTIEGGTATNIVPNLCEFTFDYRNLPSMGTQDILPVIKQRITELNQQMQQVDSQTGIKIEQLESVPAMTDTESEALQQLIAGLVQSSVRHKVAYATEGGQFTNAGIATVICGPGSIEQAHKADEYVELAQLAECDDFLQKLLQSLQS